jgi:hypothetical protein
MTRLIITFRSSYERTKKSVRTSQEIHYIFATKPNRLMLFILRTIRNTEFEMLNEMMHAFKGLGLFVSSGCIAEYGRVDREQ